MATPTTPTDTSQRGVQRGLRTPAGSLQKAAQAPGEPPAEKLRPYQLKYWYNQASYATAKYGKTTNIGYHMVGAALTLLAGFTHPFPFISAHMMLQAALILAFLQLVRGLMLAKSIHGKSEQPAPVTSSAPTSRWQRLLKLLNLETAASFLAPVGEMFYKCVGIMHLMQAVHASYALSLTIALVLPSFNMLNKTLTNLRGLDLLQRNRAKQTSSGKPFGWVRKFGLPCKLFDVTLNVFIAVVSAIASPLFGMPLPLALALSVGLLFCQTCEGLVNAYAHYGRDKNLHGSVAQQTNMMTQALYAPNQAKRHALNGGWVVVSSVASLNKGYVRATIAITSLYAAGFGGSHWLIIAIGATFGLISTVSTGLTDWRQYAYATMEAKKRDDTFEGDKSGWSYKRVAALLITPRSSAQSSRSSTEFTAPEEASTPTRSRASSFMSNTVSAADGAPPSLAAVNAGR